MDQILSLGIRVIEEFRGKSFFGKIISVLTTPSEWESSKPRSYYNHEAYEPYLRCMNGSQHKDVYEILAFLLAIIIIVFILITFVLVVVLVRKHVSLKNFSSNHLTARLTNINTFDRPRALEPPTRVQSQWF